MAVQLTLFRIVLVLTSSLAIASAKVPTKLDERTYVFEQSSDAHSIPEPLNIYFDQRLTFIFPDEVEVAVPGSPDVLTAHVRNQVVVVSLVDSPYVRERRPETNLTILSKDGTALTCRILVASNTSEVQYHLVQIERGRDLNRRAEEDAIASTKAWLAGEGSALVTRYDEALSPLLALRTRREIGRLVAHGGLEVLSQGVRRTRESFIYWSCLGAVRLGDQVILQLEGRNHSQPDFHLGSVALVADREAREVELIVVSEDDLLRSDGEPRAVAVVGPAAAFRGESLALKLCERGSRGRCVTAELW